jgi:hypothetical protein
LQVLYDIREEESMDLVKKITLITVSLSLFVVWGCTGIRPKTAKEIKI